LGIKGTALLSRNEAAPIFQTIMKIYGIANCDTCRKARKWLEATGHSHEWIDLRADGVDAATIAGWIESVGTDALVNRRSKTWRELDEKQRTRAGSADEAPALLVEHPTLIKRPVIDQAGTIRVGFDEAVKRSL
jgi:Spx/MgsR family transcriptional regulator